MKRYEIVKYQKKCYSLVVYRKKVMSGKDYSDKKALLCTVFILCSFLLGMLPVLFNWVIDPYNMNGYFNLGFNKQKISEKAHYPLWKIINYNKEAHTLILGDSRALALKDKYWHQLHFSGAYNFAYGGATISEIYDTFHFVKANANLKNLIIGIQLRSFSPIFKKAMNRVPEAIHLSRNPAEYYINSLVTKISWQHIEKRYDKQLKRIDDIEFNLFSKAAAQTDPLPDQRLETLLDPIYCTTCKLPYIDKSAYRPVIPRLNTRVDYGIWQGLWPLIDMRRTLPAVFSKQIRKNAKSDWKSFQFSEVYWRYLKEIADWCKANDVALYFFIPPTIVEMQQQISNYGFGRLNHQLRKRLASLALVVDFDFANSQTEDLTLFQDAYHFNYKFAKAIIGEFSLLIAPSEEVVEISKKRREKIFCPSLKGDAVFKTNNHRFEVLEGNGCRLWRLSYEN